MSITIFARRPGTPSFIKSCNHVPKCEVAAFSSLSYFWPFIVVPAFKKKYPAVPSIEMALHTITLGGCFIVCWVYVSLYRVSEGRRTFLFLTANCWVVDSSANKTLNHWAQVQSLCCQANYFSNHKQHLPIFGISFLLSCSYTNRKRFQINSQGGSIPALSDIIESVKT